MKKIFLVFLAAFTLGISCKNGLTLESGSYRAVAAFQMPKDDTLTGINIFSAQVALSNMLPSLLQSIDNETAYLELSNLPQPEAMLDLRIKLDGLVNEQYGNIKVTASYVPFDTSSANFVKQILFDKFAFMVLQKNTGTMQYDTSAVDVKIALNTATPIQAGMITLHFEYAKSVYDASVCPQSYNIFISTGVSEKPRAIFSRIKPVTTNSSLFLTGNNVSYSAEYIDKIGSEVPFQKSIPMILDILNVEAGHEIKLRPADTSKVAVSNIQTLALNGHVGSIQFDLVYDAGSSVSGIEGFVNLIVEDLSSHYEGLPFELPISTIRKVTPAPNLHGAFATAGNASPWKWRMNFRVNTVSTSAESNHTVASQVSNTLNSGSQNGKEDIETKYTYKQ